MMNRSSSFMRVSIVVMVMMMFGMLQISPVQAQDKPEKTLYSRLGGYDAIAAVVDDFFGSLMKDPQFSARFFTGHSTASFNKVRQLTVDLTCKETGGPCYYTGRDMKTTHVGLGITENDWDASVKHFVATLNKFKVPQQEQTDLLKIISSLKGDIVEKKTEK
jgi:hemoglobin